MRATLQLTSMSTSMAMLEEAMAMAMATATWTCRAAARCHWRRACKAVHFTEREREPTKAKGDTTRRHPTTASPIRHSPPCPCSLARSCFNNFHAATTKKTTSVEEGEAEAGQGQKRGGYKMSISSNNAIDKRRQLKQQKWQKSSRRSRQGAGVRAWVAGCPARRVASLCSAMRPLHVA